MRSDRTRRARDEARPCSEAWHRRHSAQQVGLCDELHPEELARGDWTLKARASGPLHVPRPPWLPSPQSQCLCLCNAHAMFFLPAAPNSFMIYDD